MGRGNNVILDVGHRKVNVFRSYGRNSDMGIL